MLELESLFDSFFISITLFNIVFSFNTNVPSSILLNIFFVIKLKIFSIFSPVKAEHSKCIKSKN